MTSIRIVSDGKVVGTKVYGPDGKQLQGVTAVTIAPLEVGSTLVTAQITFVNVELDVVADAEVPA